MIWKNYAALLEIAPQRRAVATALAYGLLMSMRLTSGVGEEPQAQAAQGCNPGTSIVMNGGGPISPLQPTQPVALLPISPLDCRKGCESSMPLRSNCGAP
jgi:hypothetical protein